MLEVFGSFQDGVTWALVAASLGFKGFALVDALRRPATAFPAAGKRTKNLWLVILGVALAANVILLYPLNIINLAGLIAAAVYVVDVRPALKQVGGGRPGTHDGPYGPW